MVDVKFINNKQYDFKLIYEDEKAQAELFYRIVFAHLAGPKSDIGKYNWDIIKKIDRQEITTLTKNIIDEMEEQKTRD